MEYLYSFRGTDGEEGWSEWVSPETAADIEREHGVTAVLISEVE